MARESALTKLQKESIEINKFIFHIISKDEDTSIHLDEITLTTEQKKFVKARIIEVAEGTQFTFINKEHNHLSNLCKNLYIDTLFKLNSELIADDFHRLHLRNMSDGAFIISTFNILDKDNSNISLIALIKMDHKKVLEYIYSDNVKNRKVQLREIANSFIESKEAMQKVAIIDVANEFKWDILAKEKNKTEGITDYFKKFLNALELDTASQLTRRVVQEASKWARINNDSLRDIPELSEKTSDFRSYINKKSINFLELNNSVIFNSDDFYSNILHNDSFTSDSQSKIDELKENIKDYFIEKSIEGQSFIPKPNSIPNKDRKTIKRTEEGVVIKWTGNAEDNKIKFSKDNNQHVITITTSNLETIEK